MQDIISTLKNALLQAEAGLEVAVGRLTKDGTERGDFKPSEVLALASVREALAMPVTCLHQIQEPAAAPAAVAVPDGYALVPVNPTAEMCKAANWSSSNRQRWADMLAAAPALAATPAADTKQAEFEAIRMFWAQHGSQKVLGMSTIADLHADVERTIRQHATAAAPTYIEVRECSDCGHIGINDADGSKAACSKCDWQGDSPVEDKCPDCNTVGTMTAACSKCGARASLLAETTLHAEAATPAADAPDLHAQIMNLPLGTFGTGIGDIGIAYRAGHRAARHAAAELATFHATQLATFSAAAPVVLPEPFALYDGEQWYANEEAAICSCANMQKLQKVYTKQQVRALLAQAATAAASAHPAEGVQTAASEDIERARLIAKASAKFHDDTTHLGNLVYVNDLVWALGVVSAHPAPEPADAQATATGLPAQAARTWSCPVRTVADLANNLLTMDQTLPIYGAQYIEHPVGQRRAIAVPPTVSIERVKDSRWIGEGEDLNTAIIWTRAEQLTAHQAQADARDGDDAALIEWLSGRYISTDYHWGDPKTTVLVIEIPQNTSVCGDFRTDVREAMAIAAAKGE